MSGPLSGITILDLTSVISGPMATAVLADQGARVIKIENPRGDSMRMGGAVHKGVSSLFNALNRNKEAIVLDLQTPEGVTALKTLAEQADILVQNYRPGVMDRLGIGYADLKQVNPSLVYGSISGVGAHGPYADRRVYDPVIQAFAGYTHAQAVDGEPNLIKMMVCDKITALTAAQALSAAYIDRLKTGVGQHVEISMLEACLYFIWPDRFFAESFVEPPEFPGIDITTMYRTLATQDGHITLICVQLDEFQGLTRALNRTDWLEDPRFADLPSMYMNFSALVDDIAQEVKKWATADLSQRLVTEDVPHGIVLSEADILKDPQVNAADVIETIEHPEAGQMRIVGRNARFSEHSPEPARAAKSLGADNLSILESFGHL